MKVMDRFEIELMLKPQFFANTIYQSHPEQDLKDNSNTEQVMVDQDLVEP